MKFLIIPINKIIFKSAHWGGGGGRDAAAAAASLNFLPFSGLNMNMMPGSSNSHQQMANFDKNSAALNQSMFDILSL